MQQLPLLMVHEPVRSFASFVTGDNAQALDAVRRLKPGSPPLYLWGPAGSGKSHLLHALAEEQLNEGATVGWFAADRPMPWLFDEGWQLLVLDGCDDFDAGMQQSAFALFVHATSCGVPVAASGSVPPVDLPLRDDLRTRLGWGEIVALQPLSDAQARAALVQEAHERGLELSEELTTYLMTHCARDLKSLMSLLDRMDRFALERKRALTLPLLRAMLMQSDAGVVEELLR